MSINSSSPIAAYNKTQCLVSEIECEPGTIVVNGRQCIPCLEINSSLPIATENHLACTSSGKFCGGFGFISGPENQCINCSKAFPDRPFANWFNDSCVALENCTNSTIGIYGNSCYPCLYLNQSAPFANLFHNECLSQASDCGPWLAEFYEFPFQCFNCSKINYIRSSSGNICGQAN